MTTRDDLESIYSELERMHAWRGWHWWPDADPFEVIAGCILVQNTMWSNVERALDRLRGAGALGVEAMASLPIERLEELVRPSGQYRQKARKLQAMLALIERHGGLDALLSLPPDMLRIELLNTFGIGPESADAIVVYAAKRPAFVIDAYTARLFSRLGHVPDTESPGYADWQMFFTSRLPVDRDSWARYHALIVMHCKHTCLKLRPRCGDCALATRCQYRLASQ